MTLAIYHQSDIVDTVSYKEAESGALRAYLHVKDGVPQETLQQVVKHMTDSGWQAIPTSENGKPELEVRNFGSKKRLEIALAENKWTSGPAHYQEDENSKPSFIDKYLKKQTLFLSSALYFLGDIKFFSYGMREANKLDMAAGVGYGAGTLANFAFGSNPLLGRPDRSDLEIHDLSKKMADYMNSQNIPIPENASIHSILDDHKKGMFKKVDDALRHYPVELMTAFFGLAGIAIAVAAYKKLQAPLNPEMVEQYVVKTFGPNLSPERMQELYKQSEPFIQRMDNISNMLDISLGSITATSGLFANLVKEKKRDPDTKPKEGMARVWEWVQERPLAITGTGLMVATMCHAVSTGIAYKVGTTDAKKAIFDRGVFVATNLIAEALIAISSKGHGSGVMADKSVANSVLSLAADTIACEPVEKQEVLIDQLSHFLGQPNALAMKDGKLKEELQRRVEGARKNPWAHAASACVEEEKDREAGKSPTSASTSKPPALAGRKRGDRLSDWQSVITTSKEAPSPDTPALP